MNFDSWNVSKEVLWFHCMYSTEAQDWHGLTMLEYFWNIFLLCLLRHWILQLSATNIYYYQVSQVKIYENAWNCAIWMPHLARLQSWWWNSCQRTVRVHVQPRISELGVIRNDENDLHRSLGCILAQWLWHQMLTSASTSSKAQALLLTKLQMGFLGFKWFWNVEKTLDENIRHRHQNAFTICLCPSTHSISIDSLVRDRYAEAIGTSLLQVQVQLRTLTALWHSRPKPGNWDCRPVAKVHSKSACWWMPWCDYEFGR